MKRKFVLQVEMTVDDEWVADGFSLHGEHMENTKEFLRGLLPYANSTEFKVKAKLICGPDKSILKKLGSI